MSGERNICPCREFKPDSLVEALASQYTELFRSKSQYFAGDMISHCEIKVHMNKCLILISYETKLFDSSDLTLFDSCLWVWIKSEFYKTSGENTRRIARCQFGCCFPHRKKHEDQLRRTKSDLRTRVAKCIEVDGGIFEYLL